MFHSLFEMYSSSGNVGFHLFLLKQFFIGGGREAKVKQSAEEMAKIPKALVLLWFLCHDFWDKSLTTSVQGEVERTGFVQFSLFSSKARGGGIAVLSCQTGKDREDGARPFSEVHMKGNGHKLQRGKFWLSIREKVQQWDFVESPPSEIFKLDQARSWAAFSKLALL